MHSLHFLHSFSRLSETFIYDYVIHLHSHDVDVEVLTLNRINESSRPFEPVHELTLPLWDPQRLYLKTRNLLTGEPLETAAWPIYQKKIKSLIGRLKPDVLHAHFGPMGVLAAPVAKELNLPLIVTFYGYDISQYAKDENWIEKYKELAEIVSGITVLSEAMKKEAQKLGFRENQIYVVHLGTDTDKIKKKVLSPPVRRFLSIGRLSEKKGHLDAIKAMHRVIEATGLPLTFDIIGEGQQEIFLKKYIAENNLQDGIRLLGRKTHNEVIEQLQNADAFILTSKTASNGDREGTPTVLIEAQAAGLPCISTFHSGIPEIIPKENHDLLAPEGDVEVISECIKKLVLENNNQIKQRGNFGRQRVENNFNIKKETLTLKALYELVL